MHVFEKAGLGRAPFKFVGAQKVTYQACPGAPIQPGGSCDFCGTGISWWCWVKDADGKRFKVGCECVERTTGSRSIAKEAKSAISREKAKERDRRDHERINRAKELLPAMSDYLRGLPHSKPYFADKGMTKLDEIEWFFANAGNKGCLWAAKYLEDRSKVSVG